MTRRIATPAAAALMLACALAFASCAETAEPGATTTTVGSSSSTTVDAAPTTALSGAEVVTVNRVIDGDTIELTDGRTVRFLGIDTPERGDCGYSEAGDRLSELLAAGDVTLITAGGDDTDRYGRILRYVEAGGLDTGAELIATGHAIARYDSRDGYDPHPREDLYITLDADSGPAAGCAEPAR
jgi:endonuclease YncB( thermonuclease family)